MSFFNDVVNIASLGTISDFDGSEGAASAQNRATDQQVSESARQYDQTRADLQPYRDIGLSNFQNLNQLSNSYSQTPEGMMNGISKSFTTSPGYLNSLELGRDTIEQGAASQGSLFSGATLKGLEKYRTGLANNEYNNYSNQYTALNDSRLNRLASLANVGPTTTSQAIQAGNTNSNNLIQAYGNYGDIAANQATSGFNSTLNLLNTGANLYGAI